CKRARRMKGNSFKLARFRFRLTARSPIELSSGYKGSTFHGAFGHALKDLSPHFYDLFFNPTLAVSGNSQNQLPKPFVLIPPLADQSQFNPGEELQFELVLFGTAVSQLPACVAAIDHLGKHMGLGTNKGRFAITAIDAIKPGGESVSVLNENGRITSIPQSEAEEFSLKPQSAPAIRINLNTRLRLTYNNQRITQAPSFELLITRLIGRIKNLTDLYGESELISSAEKQQLIEEAKTITMARQNVEWSDWPRYSGRQKEWMQFGGLLGAITYQGNLAPFLPWLALGEWTHVGGKTSFGLGKYHTEILQ
ncbi:MAG: CRISPR system precrRNA processing endoribonuclease RAMP protein Cas6, partial [Blastocatellia bacterium]